ncbi:MAG TPA: endonuclease [Planctomycetaceae bacterium]|nr:endonuclease [Planctomycetaceae bacterium]
MRLLSYNIHKGIGGADRRYDLQRIIDVIESQNPDLICLQEVDRHVRRSRYHDQPRVLAEYFRPAASLYQMNVHLKSGGYGNLILSRWPLRSHHRISLTLRTRKPRGALLAVVDTPEGPLHLICWHLGLGQRERWWQVRRLLRHRCYREAAHLPTLIVGDFNDWRNVLANGHLADQEFQQITRPASRFRSFPAVLPVSSLDKAFARGPILVKRAHIVRSRLARQASDHLPLMIDFHLREAGPHPTESGGRRA